MTSFVGGTVYKPTNIKEVRLRNGRFLLLYLAPLGNEFLRCHTLVLTLF